MQNKLNGNTPRGSGMMLVEVPKVKNPPMFVFKQTYTDAELLELPMIKKKSSVRPNSAYI